MESLLVEVWSHICYYLPKTTVLALRAVSRSLRITIDHEDLWLPLYAKLYPRLKIPSNRKLYLLYLGISENMKHADYYFTDFIGWSYTYWSPVAYYLIENRLVSKNKIKSALLMLLRKKMFQVAEEWIRINPRKCSVLYLEYLWNSGSKYLKNQESYLWLSKYLNKPIDLNFYLQAIKKFTDLDIRYDILQTIIDDYSPNLSYPQLKSIAPRWLFLKYIQYLKPAYKLHQLDKEYLVDIVTNYT